MSYQIQNSTNTLWALFCLLPIQNPVLLFALSKTKQYICLHEWHGNLMKVAYCGKKELSLIKFISIICMQLDFMYHIITCHY